MISPLKDLVVVRDILLRANISNFGPRVPYLNVIFPRPTKPLDESTYDSKFDLSIGAPNDSNLL